MSISSLGALTTTFSPPTWCLGTNIWQLPNPGMTDSYFLQGQELTSACFPDNYDPHTTAVYSPGLCPSAYTPVRMREGSSLSDTGVLTCCPTYAIFEARNTSQSNPFMSTMACQSFFGISGVVQVTKFLSVGHFGLTTLTYTNTDVLNAYGVTIAPSTSPAAATSTAASAATPVRHLDS
jgi:hypothetical protein